MKTKRISIPNFRRAWCLILLSISSMTIYAQPTFSIEAANPEAGVDSFRVIANPADTDLSRYHFMWVFENGYHEFGPAAKYGFQYTNQIGDNVDVELYASKRYDMDDDPGERVVSNITIEELTGGTYPPTMRLSRPPRSEYESLFKFSMGNKYPLLIVVTLHPSLSFNEMDPEETECFKQYPTFAPAIGNFKLEEKQHEGVSAPNKKLFYMASANSPTLGPNRGEILLPLCTENGVEIDQEMHVELQAYEIRDQALLNQIDSQNALDNIEPVMSDLWRGATPWWADTLYSLAVSSWDPNAKAAKGNTDSTVCPNGTITFQIDYENVGNAVEPTVQIFDRLPAQVNPAIYDINFDRPLTNIDDDADPATYLWEAKYLYPGESGRVTFKAHLMPGVPVGTVIENQAKITFVAAGQDTLTNTTRITVTNCEPNDRGEQAGGDDCSCPEQDCPKNWRLWLAFMFLLALIFLILWIRALQRRT